MASITKAEQIRLPEQLYVLLMSADTGEPLYDRHCTERAMSTAIVWELLNAGALQTQGNEITRVDQVAFTGSYMRRAALMASARAPVHGSDLILQVAAEMNPIWEVVGEDMVHEHLLTEEARKRFLFFHRRMLVELAEARSERRELEESLREAARNLWDANYSAEVASTHPRLLARIVILDNYCLLQPMIGMSAYRVAKPYLAQLRAHLHGMVQQATSGAATAPKTAGPAGCGQRGSSDSDCYVYNSGSDFWITTPDSGGHHGGHGSDHPDDCQCDVCTDSNSGDSGGSDSGGGDGGGGGDCGGCGGCGG